MNNQFYNQIFNPQYVNISYLNQLRAYQYEQHQTQEVANAVHAVHDLCEAIKQLDDAHQQQAFAACLAEMSQEFGWER
ncbi:MAG: hypothetical protein IJZ58_00510 [Oscillospiraceae bacterium]|nr:hypothetical protein [Oscillospiraceae bacterium]